MERFDWDDVRYFLAAAQAGSLSVAARSLGVSVATVGRRVERLEQSFGVPLMHRGVHGVTLSAEGDALLERAQQASEAMSSLWRASRSQQDAEEIVGEVTVSMIDSVVYMMVGAGLDAFLSRHPGLELTMRGEMRNAQLATLEADIVVRASRPQEQDAVAKRAIRLTYGVYAHPEYLKRFEECGEGIYRVVSYTARFARSPEMLWLRERYATHRWVLRLRTMAEIAAAVRGGVGIGLIPDVLATRELVCLQPARELGPRDIWVATHRDLQHVPRVRVVMDHMIEMLGALARDEEE